MPAIKKKPNKRSPTSKARTVRRKESVAKKKTIAESYNKNKFYEGKQYTGMQVGRSLKWYYDKGEWKDSKITPDIWRISFKVKKRRAGKAPKGSGAAVGTGYHWYILAHQYVSKLNADDYSTDMIGLKFKMAHKRAAKGTWSAKTGSQRKHLIEFLKDWINQLEKNVIPLDIEYNGKQYKGEAVPIPGTCENGVCHQLEVTLNEEVIGIIRTLKAGWKIDHVEDQKFVDAIGEEIALYYE